MTLQALQHENAIHPGKRIPKLFYLLETRHIINAAQPGIAADRFAREIGAFLKSFCAARSRQLNAKPLGHFSTSRLHHLATCLKGIEYLLQLLSMSVYPPSS